MNDLSKKLTRHLLRGEYEEIYNIMKNDHSTDRFREILDRGSSRETAIELCDEVNKSVKETKAIKMILVIMTAITCGLFLAIGVYCHSIL